MSTRGAQEVFTISDSRNFNAVEEEGVWTLRLTENRISSGGLVGSGLKIIFHQEAHLLIRSRSGHRDHERWRTMRCRQQKIKIRFDSIPKIVGIEDDQEQRV